MRKQTILLFFSLMLGFHLQAMETTAKITKRNKQLMSLASEPHGKSIEAMTALLAQGADPNYVTDNGISCLHEAVCSGHDVSNKLEVLILAGAHVNAQVKTVLKTPLHYAACLNQTQAVIDLIEAGADTNIQDSRGMTPFKWTKSEFVHTRKTFISTISCQELLPKLPQILALKRNGAYSEDAGEIIATIILPELIEAHLALIPQFCYLKSDYPETAVPEESLKAILRTAMIASINRVIRKAQCLQAITAHK